MSFGAVIIILGLIFGGLAMRSIFADWIRALFLHPVITVLALLVIATVAMYVVGVR